MRLSQYPYVVVRVACSRCARQGCYRLARLADHYGAEIEFRALLDHLAGDCTRRVSSQRAVEYCGAFFPDLAGSRPPDSPPAMMQPRLVRNAGRHG